MTLKQLMNTKRITLQQIIEAYIDNLFQRVLDEEYPMDKEAKQQLINDIIKYVKTYN